MENRSEKFLKSFEKKPNNIKIFTVIIAIMFIILYMNNTTSNKIYETIILVYISLSAAYSIFLSLCMVILGIAIQISSKKTSNKTEKEKNNKATIFLSVSKVVHNMFYNNVAKFLYKPIVNIAYSVCLYYSGMIKISVIHIFSALLFLIISFWLKSVTKTAIDILTKEEYTLLENTINTKAK